VGPTAAAYRQPVLTFRLDDLVERFGLPSAAHVKLDVDGTEPDVLAGAQRTLSDPGLRALLTELDEQVAAQLEGVLAAHGLHLHERFRREMKPGTRGPDAPQPPAYGLFTRDGGSTSAAERPSIPPTDPAVQRVTRRRLGSRVQRIGTVRYPAVERGRAPLAHSSHPRANRRWRPPVTAWT
jgi:hypothetical protein